MRGISGNLNVFQELEIADSSPIHSLVLRGTSPSTSLVLLFMLSFACTYTNIYSYCSIDSVNIMGSFLRLSASCSPILMPYTVDRVAVIQK